MCSDEDMKHVSSLGIRAALSSFTPHACSLHDSLPSSEALLCVLIVTYIRRNYRGVYAPVTVRPQDPDYFALTFQAAITGQDEGSTILCGRRYPH